MKKSQPYRSGARKAWLRFRKERSLKSVRDLVRTVHDDSCLTCRAGRHQCWNRKQLTEEMK